MGNAASRLCGDSAPTFSLSDVYERMRCLVACCGSEVHIELRDETDNNDEQNAKDPQGVSKVRCDCKIILFRAEHLMFLQANVN